MFLRIVVVNVEELRSNRRRDMDEVTALKARIVDLEAELLRYQTPTPIRKTFEPPAVRYGHLSLIWSAS